MKKFAALAALAVVFAFAAPVFAATNPFMDVPMNHWAYDAIGQLAAHGILSGYPDGTYKGQQPTTRYELASALARALAVVDMTKASKQDVAMLQKLVIEFKDELDALGVKVAEIDERLSLIEERLGGWKLSGVLRLDVTNNNSNEPPVSKGDVTLARARLFIERWFGDPENPMHFKAVLRGDQGNGRQGTENWKNFFVEIPFFFDSKVIVGRFGWDAEAKYYVNGNNVGNFAETGGFFGLDSVLTDYDVDAIGFEKSFGIGTIKGYVAHEDKGISVYNEDLTVAEQAGGAWEIFGMGEFQFNEHFGLDLGFKALLGDNFEANTSTFDRNASDATALKFNNLWHVFAGLRFNFNEDIAFKAIYYHQKFSIDEWLMADDGLGGAVPYSAKWREPDNVDDKSKHWAVMLDVNQNLLKFTSLWLEYGQYDAGFINENASAIVASGRIYRNNGYLDAAIVPVDLKYFRIVLAQKWNEKWATHLFYYGYDFDFDRGEDGKKPKEWGLGVQYTLNPNTTIGLNYMKVDYDTRGDRDDNRIRLRTQVTF